MADRRVVVFLSHADAGALRLAGSAALAAAAAGDRVDVYLFGPAVPAVVEAHDGEPDEPGALLHQAREVGDLPAHRLQRERRRGEGLARRGRARARRRRRLADDPRVVPRGRRPASSSRARVELAPRWTRAERVGPSPGAEQRAGVSVHSDAVPCIGASPWSASRSIPLPRRAVSQLAAAAAPSVALAVAPRRSRPRRRVLARAQHRAGRRAAPARPPRAAARPPPDGAAGRGDPAAPRPPGPRPRRRRRAPGPRPPPPVAGPAPRRRGRAPASRARAASS